MWDLLSENSKQILVAAQFESQKLGMNYIGSEHLMLGILDHRHNTACRELRVLGVDIDAFREKILELAHKKEQKVSEVFTLSARSARIIEIAAKIAKALGKAQVGSEHILLGLLREGIGLPAKILKSDYGITYEMTLEELYGIKELNFIDYKDSPKWTPDELSTLESRIQFEAIQKKVRQGKFDEIKRLLDYLGDLFKSVGQPDLCDEIAALRKKCFDAMEEKRERFDSRIPHENLMQTTGKDSFCHSNMDTEKSSVTKGEDGITITISIDKSYLKQAIEEAIRNSLGGR